MKEDLRVARTKKLLKDSLYDLAVTQSIKLEELSVQMICEHAMVHRTTFYRYYTDKYDFLLKAFPVDEGLTKQERHKRFLMPFSMFLHTAPFPFIDKFVLLNLDDEYLQLAITKTQSEELKKDLIELIKVKSIPVPLELAVKVYQTTLQELLIYWLKDGMRITAAEMDTYFQSLLNPFYFELLVDN